MVLALWQQLLDAITRPPRDVYTEDTLVGGARGSFRFALPGYPVRHVSNSNLTVGDWQLTVDR